MTDIDNIAYDFGAGNFSIAHINMQALNIMSNRAPSTSIKLTELDGLIARLFL